MNRLNPPKKILAIRLDHLGDVVMTRPALKALKSFFPESHLSVLVSEELAELLRHDLFVDEIIPAARHWFKRGQPNKQWGKEAQQLAHLLQGKNFDLGIDFRGDLRNILLMYQAKIPARLGYTGTGGAFLLTHSQKDFPSLHQIYHNLQLLTPLGIDKVDSKLPAFRIDPEKARDFESLYAEQLASKQIKIVLHPGAGYPAKKWPAESWKELALQLLKNEKVQVILIGTKQEKEEIAFESSPNLLDLRGKTRLEELMVLFSLSDYFIGQDSGPSHIAAAQGIQGMILFSGTNESKIWRPWSDRLTILEHSVPCSPCEAQVCPLGHHDCLAKISVEKVLERVMTFIHSPAAPR